MPITPLHFGVLSPINTWKPGTVSNTAFVLINILLDGVMLVENYYREQSVFFHGPLTHSYMGALVLSYCLIVPVKRSAWRLGIAVGAVTHVLLDSLVHPEMSPFWPLLPNSMYMGWMEPVSLFLLPFMVWWIYQIVKRWLDFYKSRSEHEPK